MIMRKTMMIMMLRIYFI